MPKHNLNEEYISALAEANKINSARRAYQNFLECTPIPLLDKMRPQLLEIERIINEEKKLYV